MGGHEENCHNLLAKRRELMQILSLSAQEATPMYPFQPAMLSMRRPRASLSTKPCFVKSLEQMQPSPYGQLAIAPCTGVVECSPILRSRHCPRPSYFEKMGTVEAGPMKFKHKPSDLLPSLVSVGRRSGAFTIPFPNKMLGKALLKSKDLGVSYIYRSLSRSKSNWCARDYKWEGTNKNWVVTHCQHWITYHQLLPVLPASNILSQFILSIPSWSAQCVPNYFHFLLILEYFFASTNTIH